MGALGIVVSAAWLKVIYSPVTHPRISDDELDYIRRGGALVDMDRSKEARAQLQSQTVATLHASSAAQLGVRAEGTVPLPGPDERPKWSYIKQLLGNRMLVGVYVAQYCITTLTYFFLTWFPVYLVKERGFSILNAGFVASLPAICGFLGGVLGGIDLGRADASRTLADVGAEGADRRRHAAVHQHDRLQLRRLGGGRRRHHGVRVLRQGARRARLGRGLGHFAEGDRGPQRVAVQHVRQHRGITTPIVIGYIVGGSGSFNGALVFVGANALVAVISYLFVVGEIRRVVLKDAWNGRRSEDKMNEVESNREKPAARPPRAPVTIRMHERDNVAIVANDGGLPAGAVLADGLVAARPRAARPQGRAGRSGRRRRGAALQRADRLRAEARSRRAAGSTNA